MTNIKFNCYHKDIIELRNKGFNIYILNDNYFTADVIFYKLKSTKKYILKKYFRLVNGVYELKNN